MKFEHAPNLLLHTNFMSFMLPESSVKMSLVPTALNLSRASSVAKDIATDTI